MLRKYKALSEVSNDKKENYKNVKEYRSWSLSPRIVREVILLVFNLANFMRIQVPGGEPNKYKNTGPVTRIIQEYRA